MFCDYKRHTPLIVKWKRVRFRLLSDYYYLNLFFFCSGNSHLLPKAIWFLILKSNLVKRVSKKNDFGELNFHVYLGPLKFFREVSVNLITNHEILVIIESENKIIVKLNFFCLV